MSAQQRELRVSEAARKAVCMESSEMEFSLEEKSKEVSRLSRTIREREEELGREMFDIFFFILLFILLFIYFVIYLVCYFKKDPLNCDMFEFK